MCFEAGLTITHTDYGNCYSTTEVPGNSVYIIVHCRCESFVWKVSVLKFLWKYMIPVNHKLYSFINLTLMYMLCRNTRHLVSLVVGVVWAHPSMQSAYELEIHMFWIKCLPPIDKHPMYI